MASQTIVQLRPATGRPEGRHSIEVYEHKSTAIPISSNRTMLSRLARRFRITKCKNGNCDDADIAQIEKVVLETPRQDVEQQVSLPGYNLEVDKVRRIEFPGLEGRAYLDNAGTQLPPKSLIDAFAKDITSNLYGNPHTHSLPARNSARRVAAVRIRALEFFKADPDKFDLVFVANASAAIKLVGEALRDHIDSLNSDIEEGTTRGQTRLHYAYHKDAHNSLVGLRELTGNEATTVFRSDAEVEAWLGISESSTDASEHDLTLFAYPGQSNMTGRRLPLHWLKSAKQRPNTYTLLDAAALATTKQLDISSWTPDFTAISFYKIFGFPDLGALIVRKSVAQLLMGKKYFAGGTVDGVMVFGDAPRMIRRQSVHEVLEEGTLPFHNIIALDHAFDTHVRLFRSMDTVSAHVAALTRYCVAQLCALKHASGQKLCEIYSLDSLLSNDPSQHGGTIAFNLYRPDGAKISYRAVEQAADAAGIYLRSGAMCNPGGMATHLGWEAEELERLFEAGFRCSKPIEVYEGKWTGVVRVSFGAASAKGDVDLFIGFLRRIYLDRCWLDHGSKRVRV